MAIEMNLPGFVKTTKAKYLAEMARQKSLFGSNDPEGWQYLIGDARTAAYDYINALYFCTDTKEIWNKEICYGRSEINSDEIIFKSLSVSAGTYESVEVASDIVTITGIITSTIKGISTANPNQKRVVFYNKSSQAATFKQGVGSTGTQLHFQFSGDYVLGTGEIVEFVKDSSGVWQLNVSSYVFKNGKSINVEVDGLNITIGITTINAEDVMFADGSSLQAFIEQGGAAGPQGPQGPVGNQGATGNKGATGDKGPIGDKGPTGDRGAVGAQGARGDIGPIGPQGPRGAQGPVGAEGLIGDKGPQGPQGPIGMEGPSYFAPSGSDLKTTYNLYAPGFYQDSLRTLKKDIKAFDSSAIDIINRTEVVTFKYKDDKEEAIHIGIIADDAPNEMTGLHHNVMDTNSCVGLLLKAVQELYKEIEDLKSKMGN
ncbi:tail fiber domain-containing protein [Parabacteroides sp.]